MKHPKSPCLESILQNYFNCKKPFLKNPYYDKEERAPVTMTKHGARAYGDLVRLLYDVGFTTGIDVNKLVDALDAIADEI